MIELLKSRRSIRKFKEGKLDREIINKVLKAGLLGPTSKNKKPVEYIVVEDKETILNLGQCKSKGVDGLINAPCAIVVIADSERSDVWVEDASIAAILMQLEIENLGIGSVWIQMRNRQSNNDDSENEVRKALNIPENYGVLCIIALGYKDEIKEAYDESSIDFSKVHYGSF